MTDDETLLNTDKETVEAELDDIDARLYALLDNPHVGTESGLHIGFALEHIERAEKHLGEND